MKSKKALLNRYKYSANYIEDYSEFYNQVINKTIIPYQVEFQPPPRSTKKICWLECPYCYGLSADDTGDRMGRERAVEIMRQIATGGVKKVIFAGYATDPLNCPYLEDLLEIAIDNKMIFGFNTKALKVTQRLLDLLSRNDIVQKSYMSLSIDAGSNAVYNAVHSVKGNVKLYDKILNNVIQIGEANLASGSKFDLSAAYLINVHNHDPNEVSRFISDFQGANCNLLRFTFPQPPRGIDTDPGVVPTKNEIDAYKRKLMPIINEANNDNCVSMLMDADSEHDIFNKPRTVPCFARFVYPTVAFDGWLYHCSQSSAPNFRLMSLGDLNKSDFWDLFYNYDVSRIDEYFDICSAKMKKTGCRCDRKMHVLNQGVIDSSTF